MQLQPVGGWQVFFPSFPSVHELRPGISAQSEEAPHGSEDKDNFENIDKNIVKLPSVFGFSKHLLSCETNSSHEQSFVVSFTFRQIFGPSGFVSLQTFCPIQVAFGFLLGRYWNWHLGSSMNGAT